MGLKLYSKGWRDDLVEFLSEVEHELIIVSPYIRLDEANIVTRELDKLQETVDITVITNIKGRNLLYRSLEIEALVVLEAYSQDSQVFDLPDLHAKIYVADESRAIVTSANLTKSGIERNYEYGVSINNHSDVSKILDEIRRYKDEGTTISANKLQNLADGVSKFPKPKKKSAEDKLQKIINKILGGQTVNKLPSDNEYQQVIIDEQDIDNKYQQVLDDELPAAQFFRSVIFYLLGKEELTKDELREKIKDVSPRIRDDNRTQPYLYNGKPVKQKIWQKNHRAERRELQKEGRIGQRTGSEKLYII